MDNDKCDQSTTVNMTTASAPSMTTAASSSSSYSAPQGTGHSSYSGNAHSVSSSGNNPTSSSIFPPKPVKSILKSSSSDMPMFRSSLGMPPMMSGRRPLLPDPRMMMHYPSRFVFFFFDFWHCFFLTIVYTYILFTFFFSGLWLCHLVCYHRQ